MYNFRSSTLEQNRLIKMMKAHCLTLPRQTGTVPKVVADILVCTWCEDLPLPGEVFLCSLGNHLTCVRCHQVKALYQFRACGPSCRTTRFASVKWMARLMTRLSQENDLKSVMTPQDLARLVMDQLQCAVCRDALSYLASSCGTNEHVFCDDCVGRLTFHNPTHEGPRCPVCRDHFTQPAHYSNILLFAIYSRFEKVCKNFGCSDMATLDDWYSHTQVCPHRPVFCPRAFFSAEERCSWSGSMGVELERHLRESKCATVVELESQLPGYAVELSLVDFSTAPHNSLMN